MLYGIVGKGTERLVLEAAQNPTVGPFLRGLVDLIGIGPAKKALQQRLPARSPIQDAMNQAGAIRMGVREIPQVPGQAPKPEGFGGFRPVPNPPTSKVPLQQGPVRMEPGFTRGGSQGVQLQPGAIEPRAAELFEVDNQLRIPYNQPGKGGQAYSPLKSAENPEVAGAMMRSRLGDVADAADFPRFRGAEGQRALDLEPSVTREMMQRMAPAMAQAPRVPDPMRPMGVQMMDLSQIDPRITGAIGTAAFAVGMDRMLRDAENKRVADLTQEAPRTAESSNLPTAQEASRINELISSVVADASQQGGVYGELVLQNAPRDPSSYPSVLAYQAAQMQFLEDLASGTFTLAAKIEQQRQAESSVQSEQSGENITTETLTSELGSDDMANAVGAGVAEAEAMTTPPALAGPIDTSTAAQGASDLATAATPRPQPETRLASTAMMESLQDQIAARIAQDSEAAMRAGMSPMAQRIRFEGDIRDRDIQARASYDPRFDRR